VATAIRIYSQSHEAIKPLEESKEAAGYIVRRYYTQTEAKRLRTHDGYAANLVVMPPKRHFDLDGALAIPDLAPLLREFIAYKDTAAQVRITAPKGKGSK